MADIQLTANILTSSSTLAQGGICFSVVSQIKGPTPRELLPPATRLPTGEEVVVLNPVRRA